MSNQSYWEGTPGIVLEEPAFFEPIYVVGNHVALKRMTEWVTSPSTNYKVDNLPSGAELPTQLGGPSLLRVVQDFRIIQGHSGEDLFRHQVASNVNEFNFTVSLNRSETQELYDLEPVVCVRKHPTRQKLVAFGRAVVFFAPYESGGSDGSSIAGSSLNAELDLNEYRWFELKYGTKVGNVSCQWGPSPSFQKVSRASLITPEEPRSATYFT